MVYTVNFTMNVVDNIGMKIRMSFVGWERYCEFSLICDSIFNSEYRIKISILMRIEKRPMLNFTGRNCVPLNELFLDRGFFMS